MAQLSGIAIRKQGETNPSLPMWIFRKWARTPSPGLESLRQITMEKGIRKK